MPRKPGFSCYFVSLFALVIIICISLPSFAEGDENASSESVTASNAAAAMTVSTLLEKDTEFPFTIEAIDKELASLAENNAIASETRVKIRETWTKVQENISLAADWKGKAEEFKARAENAPGLLAEIKLRLAQPEQEIATGAMATYSLEMIAQEVNTLEAELKSNRDRLLELETSISTMTKRRLELPDLLADVKKRLQGFDNKNQGVVTTNAGPDGQKATKAFSRSQAILFEEEMKAYQRQLETYETRLNLAKSQRELALRLSNEVDEKLQVLRVIFNEAKKREMEEVTRKAQLELREFARSLPAIAAIAQENADYAAKRSEIVSIAEGSSQEFDESSRKLAKLIEDQKSLEEKVRGMGFSDYLGLLFRVKRTELPAPSIYRERLQRRKSLITRIQGQLLILEEKAAGMYDQKKLHRDIIQSLNGQIAPDRSKAIETSLSNLLATRRELIDSLIKDYHSLFVKLADLDSMERRLLSSIRQFEGFISKHIFWIPSCQAFSFKDLPDTMSALSSVFDAAKWQPIWSMFTNTATTSPWPVGGAILILILLLWGHRRAITYNRELAEKITDPDQDSFWLTVKSLLLTIYMTSFVPALIAFVYVFTFWSEEAVGVGKYLEEGLLTILPITWALLFIRGVFREKGLANTHFKWHFENVYSLLRSRLLLLTAIGVPLYLFADIVLYHGGDRMQESLGRLLFLITALTSAYLLHPVLYPSGVVFSDIGQRFPNSLVCRSRHVMYFFSVIFPIFLCLLALLGYLYTAQQLFMRNVQTLLLFFGAVFAYGFVTRFLQLQTRSLAVLLNHEKPETQENLNSESAFLEGQKVNLHSQKSESIYSISTQTRNMIFGFLILGVAAGLWGIWSDVFPAARILEQFPLWTTDSKVSEEITMADGTIASQIVDRVIPITLLDLLAAITVAILTFVFARNIPGVLEFTVLKRLPLDNGVRFAISSLTTYFVTILGVIWSFYLLGVGWDKVQWLVTGVSVGLGFGLQEIFANFISGLILLFERPMRVGDIVTVGEHSGLVTRIQIRATTILNHDKRELIIPNKNFITGQIINWTLTDRVIRIVISVGVAYDSDLKKVRNVLLRVAETNTKILRDPHPRALLVNFGDSSLDFELRVFIPSPDVYPEFTHDLNVAVAEEFRKEGISIPFPQRDVHMIPVPSSNK